MGSSLVSILNSPPNMYLSLIPKLASVIVDGRWQIPGPILDNLIISANILKITLPVNPLPNKRV